MSDRPNILYRPSLGPKTSFLKKFFYPRPFLPTPPLQFRAVVAQNWPYDFRIRISALSWYWKLLYAVPLQKYFILTVKNIISIPAATFDPFSSKSSQSGPGPDPVQQCGSPVFFLGVNSRGGNFPKFRPPSAAL